MTDLPFGPLDPMDRDNEIRPHTIGTHRNIDAWTLPAVFRVDVMPTAKTIELADHLGELVKWAMLIYEVLAVPYAASDPRSVMNIAAAASYSNLIISCQRTVVALHGDGIRAADVGNPEPERVELMEKRYARLLSGNMTKINNAIGFANQEAKSQRQADIETPDQPPSAWRKGILNEKGEAYYWVSADLTRLIATSRTAIENWAALRKWQALRHKSTRADDYREKEKALIGKAKSK